MRTQTKIMVLLVITIGLFAGVFIGYQYIKIRQERIFALANEQSKNQIIDNILRFKEKNHSGPVNDYSCWDEMTAYVKNPNPEWENVNLTTLSTFGFSNTWIFDKDYKTVYSQFDSTIFREGINLPKDIIAKGFKGKGSCHFFLNVRDTILEITGSTIVPSSDINHETTPQGYFLAANYWNKKYLQQMESEMDFSIDLRLLKDSLNTKTDNSKITISKHLKDFNGEDVIIVDFTSKNQLSKDLSSINKLSYGLIGLLAITFIIFFFAIRRWVAKPLSIIANSLNSENNTLIAKIEGKNDEFGEIAKLIKQFFEQKLQLEIEIAEHIETQKTVKELYENTVNLNHELQASEEELRQNLDMTMELNEVLSKQQREITDSINYAARIQAALLPPSDILNQLERDYFILYKPRNIVGGDFYWTHKHGNKAVIAVADCTGHGVPGGFMSMLGMAFLAEIVNQDFGLSSGEILDQLRRRVIDSLHQSGRSGESKDGMDIALCIIDFESLTMQYSGAYNSLYVVRKDIKSDGSEQVECIETKADRMPIGYSLKMNSKFTTNNIKLEQNDMIYLLTDGFQDQLSNKTKQKFKRTRIKELMVLMHEHDLQEQKNLLEVTFDGYRDDYQQIDDVLIFGIRI